MINVGQAVGYLDLDISGFTTGIQSAIKQLKSLDDATLTSEKKFENFGSAATTMGKTLTKQITVPLAAVGTASIAASVKFESAFAGVIKTVDATEQEFAQLRTGIKELSERMPQSAAAIAEVAEAAGQLGIKTENILSFTETMIQLGDATNLTSTEAATALARLANITQMSQDDFDKLGSVIVELGNNLATTESEIVDMSLGIAAAGKQVGLSEAQIMSFAGALSSVGIESAAGGTAISKLMIQMQLAVETGNNDLKAFSQVAGMTVKDFTKLFKEDAASALTSFIYGLNDAERNGMSAIAVLDNMGFSEVRLRDTILRAAGAGDLFTKSLEMGNKAWDKNAALQNEATKRYETTESKLSMLRNQVVNLGIEIGDELLPLFKKVIQKISDFLKWFKSLDSGTKSMIVRIGLLVASIGPLLIIIGKISTGISALIKIGTAVKTFLIAFNAKTIAATGSVNAMAYAQTALNTVLKANPYILVATLIAGIVTATVGWIAKTREQTSAENNLSDAMKNAISEYNNSIQTIDSETKSMQANIIVADNLVSKLYALEEQSGNTTEKKQQMKAIIEQLNNLIPDLNLSLDDETGKLNLQRNEVEKLITSYKNLAISKAYSEKIEAEAKRYVEATEQLEKAQEDLKKANEDMENYEYRGAFVLDIRNTTEITKRQVAAENVIKEMNDIIKESQENMDIYQKKYEDLTKTVYDNSNQTKESTETSIEQIKKETEVKQEEKEKQIGYEKQASKEEVAAARKAAKEREQAAQKAAKAEQKAAEDAAKAEKNRYDKVVDLNKEYAKKIKETNKELEKDITLLNDKYNEQLESRATAIVNSMSLFEKFNAESEYSGRQLLKNLKSQVEGIKEWRENLEVLQEKGISSELLLLQEKGISSELLQQLRELGPSSAGEIEALTKLTEKQLEEYSNLWQEKMQQAQEEATIELRPLRDETDKEIQKVIEESAIKLQELQKEYQDALQELGITITPVAEESGAQIIRAIEIGIDENEESLLNKLYSLKYEIEDIVSSINKTVASMSVVNSSDNGNVDGSHADGLSYVPYDNYKANLHEGERVLTKQENKEYSKNNNGNVNITMKVTGSNAAIVRALKPEFEIDDKREGDSY